MKVAYLVARYPAVSQTFVVGEVLGLRAQGIEVHTLAIRRSAPEEVLSRVDREAFESTYTVLPPRPSTLQAVESANTDKIYSDSSGAYFYLDNLDRAVVADAAQHIQRIAHVQAQDGSWSFKQTDDWNLSSYLPHDCTTVTNPLPQGSCDPITGVLPDCGTGCCGGSVGMAGSAHSTRTAARFTSSGYAVSRSRTRTPSATLDAAPSRTPTRCAPGRAGSLLRTAPGGRADARCR